MTSSTLVVIAKDTDGFNQAGAEAIPPKLAGTGSSIYLPVPY
ncbi:MAG: hypothetical protein ABSG60_11115 [Terracidiphilus sp.]|jgi:hypothetical protein